MDPPRRVEQSGPQAEQRGLASTPAADFKPVGMDSAGILFLS